MQITQQDDAKEEGVDNQSKKAKNLAQETKYDEEQRSDVLQILIVVHFFQAKMKFFCLLTLFIHWLLEDKGNLESNNVNNHFNLSFILNCNIFTQQFVNL